MANIWEALGLSKKEWEGMDSDYRSKIQSNYKATGNSSAVDEKSQKNYLNLVQQSIDAQMTLVGLIAQGGQNQESLNAITDLGNKAIEKEQTLRKDIVTSLGQIGKLQEQTSRKVLDASVQLYKYGIDTTRTFQTLAEISDEIGRNLSISSEDIERLTLMTESLGMTAQESAEVVQGFEQMGLSMGSAVDKTMEMAEVARLQGVNVDKFMGNIAARMDTLNSYNFSEGVKGFARMAAQAQRLGIDMGKVVSLAEKVMSPEGAIELAANLQVLGGAAGDLADPFKLMYMATNDLEGLQDALVGAGRDLTVFNEETGRLEIPPTSIRQIGALASELDMTREEFTRMIEQQHKFEMMQDQFSLDFLQSEDAAELQGFISGMATMGEGGKFEIDIGGDMVKLQDLGVEQIDALRQQMEDQRLEGERFDGMDEKQLMVEQLNALEVIARTIETPGKAIEAALIKNLDLSALNKIGAGGAMQIDMGTIQTLADKLSISVKEGIQTVLFGSTQEQENMAAAGIEKSFATGSAFDEMVQKGIQFFNDGIATFAGHLGVQNDYSTTGPAHIMSSDGFASVGGNDTLFSLDFSKIGQTNLGPGELAKTISGGGDVSSYFDQTFASNTNISGMDDINVKQETSGTINIVLDGKNLGNLDPMKILSNDQYIQILKSRFQAVSMTGKPDYIEINKGYDLN